MTIWTPFALAPIVTTWLALRRTDLGRGGLTLVVTTAVLVGVGLSSALWWLLLNLPVPVSVVRAIDAIIWTVAAAWLWWTRPRVLPATAAPVRFAVGPSRAVRAYALSVSLALFFPVLVLFVVNAVGSGLASPDGTWDSWSIWNVRARFLTAGDPLWRVAFEPPTPHADYPLLLPASIARAWTYLGRIPIAVPSAFGGMFAAVVVVLMLTSVRRERHLPLGLLAAVFMMANPRFIVWSYGQIADIPLSAYMLLALVLAHVARKGETGRAPAALAGLVAGLAAWTKNEGWLFVLAFFAGQLTATVVARDRRSGWRRLGLMAAGAAPVLLFVAAFKLTIPETNDLVEVLTVARAREMLTDWGRITFIWEWVEPELLQSGTSGVGVLPLLALFLLVAGVTRAGLGEAGPAFVTTVIVLCGYFAVYLMSPHSLTWHLRTSLDRLVLQVTPALVWAVMLAATTSLRPSPLDR